MNFINKILDDYPEKENILIIPATSYVRWNKKIKLTTKLDEKLFGDFKGGEKFFGSIIKGYAHLGHLEIYGFISADLIDVKNNKFINSFGLFQTRRHYRQRANLDIIKYSCEQLCNYLVDIEEKYIGAKIEVAMIYPGITNGLDRLQVAPILRDLPDNVNVYLPGD